MKNRTQRLSLADLQPHDPKTGDIRAVIETPKGSSNKFLYDSKWNCFELSSTLPLGMIFPFDFGFIPSTLAQDGDPIDVLIFMDTSVPMGCTLFCRLIGVIEAEQKDHDTPWEENNRLIAVARDARIHEAIKHIDDVPKQSLKEIEQFFIEYNKLHGKTFRFLGVGGPKKANKLLAAAIGAYKSKRR